MQEKGCREFADRQGLHVLEVFIERGESAKTLDRTEFTKAIIFCSQKKHHVDFFIVYKLDRFARNQEDHVSVRTLLRNVGTELRSVTEPINDTSTGRMMEGIISVFAEFDNNVRTERTKAGMLSRIRQGNWCWSSPLGFQRLQGSSNITQDPNVAPFIRLAFEQFATGRYTYQSLADFLAERGLRTRHGKRPCPQLIEKILKNSLYCGLICMWGERVTGNFEPIVSEELFQACQENPRRRTSISPCRKSDNPQFPLRGFIVCSVCKRPLTASAPRGKLGKHYPYYHHTKQNCRAARFIPKQSMEQLFIDFLTSITPEPRFLSLFKKIVISFWHESYSNLDGVRKRLKLDVSQLEAERQRVYDLHRQGKYTDDEFHEQKTLVTERIREKQDRLAGLTTHENIDIEKLVKDCCSFVSQAPQIWLESTLEQRRWFQHMIFSGGKIAFDGKGFGTRNLSLIYKLKETSRGEKSLLVALQGKSWNPLVEEIKRWIGLSRALESMN